MAASVRSPVAWASASSRRRFCSSTFHFGSCVLVCLRVMHRAICLSANRAGFAPLDAFGDNGLGGVLARFELRAGGLLFRLGLLLPDFDILVSGKRGAAFLLLTIARADLYQLGFRCDGLPDVCVQLHGIAFRV